MRCETQTGRPADRAASLVSAAEYSVTDDQTASQTIRIGAVSYLNSRPLIEGLDAGGPGYSLKVDYPSRLADALSSGQLDVALIPSVELFRGDDYEVISTACVAARGPVMSVKLYSRCPFGEIRSLALDEGSRTSAALAGILLQRRYGVSPRLEPLPLGDTVESAETDAILLIGDRAMHPPGEQFAGTWDLGEEWLNWTGLPFVFALWAARRDTVPDSLCRQLSAARDRGLLQLDEIARREAPRLGLTEETASHYLHRNLHFRLGSAERSGLRLFRRLAVEQGLAPEGAELVFRNHATA